MSKLTNDGLTRSGTGCFIAIPIWQQWVKGTLRTAVVFVFSPTSHISDRYDNDSVMFSS